MDNSSQGMFEQHPVPSQISAYQFRLVGDMTLKQFFQLAGGALIAVLIYSAPLPAIFKWPAIAFFVVLGAAFAFLPIENRPLDQWIVAFFRSIYSPTIFRWKKIDTPPQYFQSVAGAVQVKDDQKEQVTQKEIAIPKDEPTPVSVTKLEQSEKSFMSNISKLMGTNGPRSTKASLLRQRLRKGTALGARQAESQLAPEASTVVTAPPAFTQKAAALPQTKPVIEEVTVKIPQTTNVKVEPKKSEAVVVKAPRVQQTTPVATTIVPQTLVSTKPVATRVVKPEFSAAAAPPNPPISPNVVVGQVLDNTGKIVEGAIIEVRDPQGRPLRAFKTNKAGHFFSVTPLQNGLYKLLAEKEGLTFNEVSFEAKGQMIPAISIRSN